VDIVADETQLSCHAGRLGFGGDVDPRTLQPFIMQVEECNGDGWLPTEHAVQLHTPRALDEDEAET